ncbi:helix-hairpin-helix domain-containing protein [Azohydromonas sp.]|uniref:helix-hairpin-helix domain-containing protein n=1 Tax=Azohydromonas sp. TaxID=1872666 RepID=UPI002C8896C3|nr:helix-hairpin-helix domain-containing protein [Azohydromonas sp.]HMM85966.1 helix-hairpin-helix domain-containing protein [Azohydromonas sp.]
MDNPPPAAPGDNAAIARMLREMAALLDAQGGSPYRARAYRHAADTVAGWPLPVRTVFERDGLAGLDALPGVGAGIAAAVAEILACGRWGRLERLRGEVDVEALFRTIPGVGPELARRLHDALGVDTLVALEAAAHDGRLEQLPRIGPRRAAAIRAALTAMLDRQRHLRRAAAPAAATGDAPPVALLLDVDRDYRDAATADRLPKIAPRRFNPQGEAWLPVLHAQRGDWHCTALFSNTARAHELGRVHDWVVLYVEDPAHVERQYTVVTAGAGTLAGRRVVRGREAECAAWYARGDAAGGAAAASR